MQKFLSKITIIDFKNNAKRRLQLLEIMSLTNEVMEGVENSIDIISISYEMDEKINYNKYVKKEINKLIKYYNRIYERINDTENNDIYFKSIGENYFIKNYIGFESIEEFDKFNRIDFNLYKNTFLMKHIRYFHYRLSCIWHYNNIFIYLFKIYL